MMVDGKWLDNVTCPHCRYRHPAELSCDDAKRKAITGRHRMRKEPKVPELTDMTFQLPTRVMATIDRVSALSGVPVGEVFNVMLALHLVKCEDR